MRFALSTEQQDFATSLREQLTDAKTPQVIRAWNAGDTGPGRALLRQLADTGVTGLAITEEHGGLGADPVDLAVAFIEIGRAAVPGPLVESAAVIPALLHGDPATQWLPAIAEGTALATLTFDPHVPRALDADVCELVVAVHDGAVHEATPGDRVVSVDAARRLFDVEPGAKLADASGADAFEYGAFATAAQLLGAGLAMLDLTTEYAKGRVQFGRAIGQFQAVKHHLADALVALEMARPLLFGAAIALHAHTDVDRAVSAAKIACGDAAYVAARKALQVHGAIGYTAEYDLSLWLTKVRALQSAWGTAPVHRERVARSLRGGR